jgi:hypothetical protein
MLSKGKMGAALFTLLCLGLAAAEYRRKAPFDQQFVGLVFVAVLPWGLPWMSTLIKSLKVGGLELDFRELKAEIQEAREATKALASGLQAAPQPEATPPDGFTDKSLGTAVADDFEGPESDQTVPNLRKSEPRVDDFGNNPAADSRRLSATIKPFLGSDELFMIHASVNSTDPARPLVDGTPVTFYLPRFNPPVAVVKAADGVAAIDRVARGSFTLGAQVDGVRLGLRLHTVPGAPERFKSQ